MTEVHEEYVSCDLCGADDAEQILAKEGTFYVRCRPCGFIYTCPKISDPAADNEQFFEARLQEYIGAQYSPRKQRGYEDVLRQFEPFRRTGRLLEIGSNAGGFLYRAREMGWQPTGVEPVNICARYALREHGLETITSTLEQADLEKNAFDVVYSNAVFEHLTAPSRVLAAAVRVTRPGGVIYTKTVNYDSYTRQQMGREWKLLKPLEHVSLFTPETLERFYTQAGLGILKVQSQGFRNANGEGDRLLKWLRKRTLSMLGRFTLKGDRIIVLGRKPA